MRSNGALVVPGFYCKEGSAEPVPCPGGHVGNATGLYSAGQCTPVERGFWAPLGSSTPEPCPTSGFYCPGALRDELWGGAKPVLMPVGQSTETQEVATVEQKMALDISIDDFAAQREKLIEKLAKQYGVDKSLITLEATEVRRRKLQGGGIEITVTIATSDSTGRSVDLEQIQQAVQAVDDTALASSIGEVMGAPVTVTSQPAVISTAEIEVPFLCPKGKWCTAGAPSRFEVRTPCSLPALLPNGRRNETCTPSRLTSQVSSSTARSARTTRSRTRTLRRRASCARSTRSPSRRTRPSAHNASAWTATTTPTRAPPSTPSCCASRRRSATTTRTSVRPSQ